MGLGEVGLEPDGLAVGGDGLVELALAPQGVAEVGVGLGVVGLEPDRLAESARRSASSRFPWSRRACRGCSGPRRSRA